MADEYKLIIAIVPNGRATFMTEAALSVGATGGTVARALGTAKTTFLQILGLCDSAKEIVFVATKESDERAIRSSMEEAAKSYKKPFGVLFTVNLTDFFIRSGKMEMTNIAQGSLAPNDAKFALVTFIVNRGLADSVMDAARGAGAQGGTVINAHGTARPGDSKFFGLEIVPEKEMVLILTQKENAKNIMSAVASLECLKKKGSGVSFSVAAEDFTLLGK